MNDCRCHVCFAPRVRRVSFAQVGSIECAEGGRREQPSHTRSPPTIVDSDALATINKINGILATHSGRDKITKLMQYGSRVRLLRAPRGLFLAHPE